jgi:hypothetical protein
METLLCPDDDSVCVAVEFFEVDNWGWCQNNSRETNITPNQPLSTITGLDVQQWLEQESAKFEIAYVFGPGDAWMHRPLVEHANGQACLKVCVMKSTPCNGPNRHATFRSNLDSWDEFLGYCLLDAASAGCYRCVRMLIEDLRVPVSFQSRTYQWTAMGCLDEMIEENGYVSLQVRATREYLIARGAINPSRHVNVYHY